MKNQLAFKLAVSGVIGALYAGLTYLFAFSSFTANQLRVAEALTLMPMLIPQASCCGLLFIQSYKRLRNSRFNNRAFSHSARRLSNLPLQELFLGRVLACSYKRRRYRKHAHFSLRRVFLALAYCKYGADSPGAGYGLLCPGDTPGLCAQTQQGLFQKALRFGGSASE